jgi:hypothetical protein
LMSQLYSTLKLQRIPAESVEWVDKLDKVDLLVVCNTR